MLGELVGRGELRRSIGLVFFGFCFISISFLLRFMPCSKASILVFARKRHRWCRFPSTRLTHVLLCFSFHQKSRDRSGRPFSQLMGRVLYPKPESRTLSLLFDLFEHVTEDVKGDSLLSSVSRETPGTPCLCKICMHVEMQRSITCETEWHLLRDMFLAVFSCVSDLRAFVSLTIQTLPYNDTRRGPKDILYLS